MSDPQTDEVLAEFLAESRENLDQLDRELVLLEEEPTSSALLSSVFRTIHTLKGTAGFFNFTKLEAVAHVGETLLSRLRDGEIVLDAERTSGLLVMVDAIRGLLSQIEQDGTEGSVQHGALIDALGLLADEHTKAAGVRVIAELRRAPRSSPGPASDALAVERQAPRVAPEEHRSPADTRVRVDVALLDRLMNLVGELVLGRNQLLQHVGGSGNAALVTTCQRLNLITTELQEGVMKTRMQPIDNVWSKFPRVVRDLSQACGKQVVLELEGKSTELDKSIIEAIADPLTHLVRNAIDHGIEPPAERLASGKAAHGTLRLRAFHEGGRVNIEIHDDGRGIDAERIRSKAVERGLIAPERARALSAAEALGLIFLPGFSTAAHVTNVSGRGVGMDVVRSNIERIGGSVEVDARVGQGTAIRLKIPLTLAIIPALVVSAGGERFAIPQVNLVELVRFDAEQVRKSVEWIHSVPVFRLRGSLLALVDLGRTLSLPEAPREELNIVVLQADDRQFGLLVDKINDTEEIVVKPLARELKGLDVYAGATIMGDGRIALILDVLGLAARARVTAAEARQAVKTGAMAETTAAERLLVFTAGGGCRMALPLAAVARLEEFHRSQLEVMGSERVVQYRGQILRLVDLNEQLGGDGSESDPLRVVVHTGSEGSAGLVVDTIVDIVEERLELQPRSGRPGVLGAAVVQGRVTELLDINMLRKRAEARC